MQYWILTQIYVAIWHHYATKPAIRWYDWNSTFAFVVMSSYIRECFNSFVHQEQTLMKFDSKHKHFKSKKMHLKIENLIWKINMSAILIWAQCSDSMIPEWCESNFTCVFYKLILQIDILSSSCEIGFKWMPQNPMVDNSTPFQVVVWCSQIIASANADPRVLIQIFVMTHYMASLGHNELIHHSSNIFQACILDIGAINSLRPIDAYIYTCVYIYICL